MFKLARPFFIRALSPMHVGSGSDLGIVDLPIQRERHTGFPKIEASSLKGSLREAIENISDEEKQKVLNEKLKDKEINLDALGNELNLLHKYSHTVNLVFGYDGDGLADKVTEKFGENTEFAGAIGFSDARILLFPVKSVKGVFAWITSRDVLNRFLYDLKLTEIKKDFQIPRLNSGEAVVANKNFIAINNNVILEEYSYEIQDADISGIINELANLTGLNEIKDRLVILDNDSFKDFVNLSTEVITRTKIDSETGTVAKGALFNEEYLPAETVMYFITFTSPIFQKDDHKGIFKGVQKENEAEVVFDFFRNSLPEVIQIGGNATLGKGIVEIKEVQNA